MTRSRCLLLALLALALAAGLTVPGSVASSAATRGHGTARDGDFVGIDGQTHATAPATVAGRRGTLFAGLDLDLACGSGGRGLERSMRSMTKLARVIARSGRRVVWTLGPSKISALARDVEPAQLPHGACDVQGLAEKRTVLDTYADPLYLPLRKLVARDKRQTYYKTDIHWTTVGASVFSRALARRLDPSVAGLQRYSYTTDFDLGSFSAALGAPLIPENAPAALPAGPVKIRTAKRSTAWSDASTITFDHAWRTRPARRAYPGRTLLLGDSFMFQALQTMRPVFAHGRFLWVEHVPVAQVVEQIAKADTVVLEVVQPFVELGQVVTSRGFRRDVARELRARRR